MHPAKQVPDKIAIEEVVLVYCETVIFSCT